MITTQRELRAQFWAVHPALPRKRVGGHYPQNDQPCDTRAAWVEYVDALERDGSISAALAERAILA